MCASWSDGSGGLPIFLLRELGDLAASGAPSAVLSASLFTSSRSSSRKSCCSASGARRAGSYVSPSRISELPLSPSEMRTKAAASRPCVSSAWKRNSDSRGV